MAADWIATDPQASDSTTNETAQSKDDSLSGAIHADMAEIDRCRAGPNGADPEMDRTVRQVRCERFIDEDIDEKLMTTKTRFTCETWRLVCHRMPMQIKTNWICFFLKQQSSFSVILPPDTRPLPDRPRDRSRRLPIRVRCFLWLNDTSYTKSVSKSE